MSVSRIQLDGKAILEKDFKTAMRGYNQEEVDKFLDTIIQDYDLFQQEIDRLQQENEKLKKGASETSRLRSNQQQQQQSAPQVNYDVLKRLSNLEKAVFGKKFADSEG